MVLREAGDRRPQVHEGAYVDESSLVIGGVTLHAGASVWPFALLRADDDTVEVGEGSAIMDMAFLEAPEGRPVKVGRGCLISHCARLHGCVIEDDTLVGVGATVLDGARVGRGSVIASGALVLPNEEIPAGSVAAGLPAKVLRAATREDAARLRDELGRVSEKAGRYAAGKA